ncbi:MAG: GvpL/GvpF family gas vesicle protein [Chloroflexi bacterium]|uniref:GvpL/GvpF family gas vesicle protein n=1 Tax=Candidatus Chlorohelix allophototropha TaxID=3003348 RepID=A0A8T7M6R4_9CHLR|nr:GvpL/GvpF family gas vesicle protein [Chloroflexota bacterium]WJW69741.1 GvpL/GvpF family gas vesicle protein [Chloroflexota bacterium L227-S17]
MSDEGVKKTKSGYKGRYLYCFTLSDNAIPELEIAGVPVPNSQGVTRVYSIIVGRVAAVTSDSPITRYSINRTNLLSHEKVVEHVMNTVKGPVLPVKFGTVANSEKELVETLLTNRETELAELLESFKQHVEVGIKALWQRERIFAELAALPEIQSIRARLGESQQDKIELGQTVERALNDLRERDAQLILARLEPLAREVKLNAITLDMLVLNASFLVDNEKETAFDEAVNALDDELGGRLTLKYAGPLPPYNFVHFNLGL